MSGSPPSIKPNDGWRKKPIPQKQAEYLHDLMCKMFAMMSRGEAFDMIKNILEAKGPRGLTRRRRRPNRRPNRHSYDNDTLEDNK